MQQRIEFPPEFGTRLSVSVDTEEEFHWAGELTRDDHGTSSIGALKDGQDYFAAASVVPLYYIDVPVAEQARTVDILGPAVASGQAEVGAHLHPWVTPPFDEDVNRVNSYAGNLPEELERAKICYIRDLIANRFGRRPIAYRAGRYGIGPNSYRILAEEGFRCDSSVRSLFNYQDDGGPDFSYAAHHPYFADSAHRIVELPLTSVFAGQAGRFGRSLYRRLDGFPRLRGLLSRTGLVERVALTPEGIPPDRACVAIDIALDIGIRLMSISFHSPSLVPGHTPYVQSAAELADFYRWFDIVLNHAAKRGVIPSSLADILDAVPSPERRSTCARA